ncbi:MAG TPA: N-acetyl-gamma-glutamyl-phosphate reductase [Jatrophihabitans sp.]|nr:N-acetyl-gamma-glutamyl-phosphate reductase [Jatrophihabitans sp.]
MSLMAAVAGASGAVGGELLRLLERHPKFELGALTAETHAGRSVPEVHPNLTVLADRTFEPIDPARLTECDVAFLALPRDKAGPIAKQLPESVRIVDLGPDHRLADADVWRRYYESEHAGHWLYGLPELPGTRDRIAAAYRVANPGCYATAAILALAPLLAAGLADPADIVATVLAGTSSAGRAAPTEHLASAVAGALRGYQVGGEHGSVPEIEQELSAVSGRPASISVMPVLAPVPRGILAICSVRLTRPATMVELREILAQAYRDEPFVRLSSGGRWPATGAVVGSNLSLLQATADSHSGRAVVMAALDNLGKGAAGQAIQSANLMLGLPESAGLI